MAQTEKVEMKFFDHSWPAVGAAGATGLASTGLQTQGEHGPGELDDRQRKASKTDTHGERVKARARV